MIKEILLIEHIDEGIEISIEESSETKDIFVTGIYTTADKQNKNGRIYPRSVLIPEIARLQEMVSKNRLTGELDHPEAISTSLSNVSHKIVELDWDNKYVVGRSKLLDTRAGLDAQALIRGGVEVGISSRATGKLTKKSGSNIVESLNMKTWDLVSSPSNYESHMTAVFESEFGYSLKDCNKSDEEVKENIEELASKKNKMYGMLSAFYNTLK